MAKFSKNRSRKPLADDTLWLSRSDFEHEGERFTLSVRAEAETPVKKNGVWFKLELDAHEAKRFCDFVQGRAA